jgi:hypothetical protein
MTLDFSSDERTTSSVLMLRAYLGPSIAEQHAPSAGDLSIKRTLDQVINVIACPLPQHAPQEQVSFQAFHGFRVWGAGVAKVCIS